MRVCLCEREAERGRDALLRGLLTQSIKAVWDSHRDTEGLRAGAAHRHRPRWNTNVGPLFSPTTPNAVSPYLARSGFDAARFCRSFINVLKYFPFGTVLCWESVSPGDFTATSLANDYFCIVQTQNSNYSLVVFAFLFSFLLGCFPIINYILSLICTSPLWLKQKWQHPTLKPPAVNPYHGKPMYHHS